MSGRKRERILGASLSSLVKKFSKNDVIAQMEKEYQSTAIKRIPLSLIDDNSFIRRVKFSDEVIDSFAQGIKEKGIYSPLVVRPQGDRFELILGRKRYFGAIKDGICDIPCVSKEFGDEETLLMLLADNRDQRESNVVEMALVCRDLQSRFHYSQLTLSNISHQSRSQITNTMRILRLSDRYLTDICLGKLTYGHAKAIVALSDADIDQILSMVYEHHLSVRETERIAKRFGGKSKLASDEEDVLVKRYTASNVDIRKKSVVFDFNSEEEKRAFLIEIMK